MGLILTSSLAPIVAHCEIYLTEDTAVKAIFPAAKMTKKEIVITDDEAKKIQDLSGEKVRDQKARCWIDPQKNVVFIDQVLGKHEYITVAVGIGADRKVKAIEILEYRETYGQQVKGVGWRQQFIGKDSSAPLKLNSDIVNISGATLSSSHVTAGVKRLLRTYEIISARL